MSTATPKHRLTLLLMAMVIATFAFDVYASAAQAACSYPAAEQVFTPYNDDGYIPNFRFMMRNQGEKGGKIRVTVSYENTHKVVKAKNNDVHSDNIEEWVPTPSLKLETGDEEERVGRISFTAKDPKSAYLLDDVYVDPFARH